MKNYTEKMHGYISESIEPPTNPQVLNSSGHLKWSPVNLRNIRKAKFCIIYGEKYLEDSCAGSFLASPAANLPSPKIQTSSG
jgi:hypothetical protein